MIARKTFIAGATLAITTAALVSRPAIAAEAPADRVAFKIVGWDDPDDAAGDQAWLVINRSRHVAWR